nr:reverse transcriptase domain-containing protein [Tanacetum cinerariifolium]
MDHYGLMTYGTSGAFQLLRGKLVYWSAKKQQFIAMSSAEAEYVAAASCCANMLWMKVNSLPVTSYMRSVHNWILKQNQLEEPPFVDHMKAICNLDVPVDSKAPKYSSPTEEETKSSSTMNTSLSHPLPPILVVGEMHKDAHQAAGGLTSLGDTSEDGAHPQLSSGSNPSVLVDKTKSVEDGLKTTHATSSENEELGADDISRNVKLEDLADILKDTRSTFFTPDSLTDEPIIVSEFLDLPHLASSVQEKLKTLDSLPVLYKKLLYERYCKKMKKRRQSSKIINYDVLTKKGSISLKLCKKKLFCSVTTGLNLGYLYIQIGEIVGFSSLAALHILRKLGSIFTLVYAAVYKAGKRLLYAKRNKAIFLRKGASKVSRERKMAKEDEEKMAFITSQGIFCYSKMAFGLKNAGATYQRLVDKAFQKQIGRNLEVCVDDLVIKSCTKQEIMRDIEETFRTLREINMKMNPKKCTSEWRKACSWDTRPRTSVKGQILEDFTMERPKDDSLVTTTKGIEFTYALRFRFDETNNEAEYEALIAGLRIVLVEELNKKSINETEVLALVEKEGDTWMTPIYEYLTEETLIAKKEKERALRRNSRRYGIDIAGPFPEGPGKVEFLIVAIDYFTKWIEAKPIVTITGTTHTKTGVKNYASAKVLPQSSIRKAMAWWKEQTEAWGKEQRHGYMVQNNEALEITLDRLEEKGEQEAIRKARRKEKIEKYYNSKVRNTSFKPGDLVYWNNDASHAKDSGKLNPKWEGPYEVTKALGKGAYKLMDHNGKLLP